MGRCFTPPEEGETRTVGIPSSAALELMHRVGVFSPVKVELL
ncbi:hypothetical protein ACIO8F_32670 [Streptomyces sp. NPDC087228]